MDCWYCQKQKAVADLFGKPACEQCANAEIRVLDAHPENEEGKALLLKMSIRAIELAHRNRIPDESTVYGNDCPNGKCTF